MEENKTAMQQPDGPAPQEEAPAPAQAAAPGGEGQAPQTDAPGGDAPRQEAPPAPQGGAAAPQPEGAGQGDEKAPPREEKGKKERKAQNKEAQQLTARLQAAEKELAAAKDTLMRTAAEYDNYRKRTAKEKDAAFNNGVSFAVSGLLPVVDTLEMAAAAPCTDEGFKKGVTMTLAKCAEALKQLGVEEIEAAGAPFDPQLHNAVMQEEATGDCASGTVTRVLQKGYRLGGKVVRHAAVAVAQ